MQQRKKGSSSSSTQPAPQPHAKQHHGGHKHRTGALTVVARISAVLVLAALAVAAGAVFYIFRENHGFAADPFPPNAPRGAADAPESALEIVAELESPPGNLAVSAEGRVFFTFHPQYPKPRNTRVAEWLVADAAWTPYPSAIAQSHLGSVLALRIHRDLLFALDYNDFAVVASPKLVTYSLASNSEVDTYTFGGGVAGIGSMLNDMHVSNDGRYVFIADTGMLSGAPAIVLYDRQERRATRHLQNHPSVTAKPYTLTVRNAPVVTPAILMGFLYIRPAVDSIALHPDGHTLFYAPVADTKLYKIATDVLIAAHEGHITSADVAAAVQVHTANKTSSDGITTDLSGTVYLTDIENGAIQAVGADGSVHTVVQSARLLRWPDGLSFGPDNYLYIACSALQLEFGGAAPGSHLWDYAPFHILRIRRPIGGRIGQ